MPVTSDRHPQHFDAYQHFCSVAICSDTYMCNIQKESAEHISRKIQTLTLQSQIGTVATNTGQGCEDLDWEMTQREDRNESSSSTVGLRGL
jgi:hypothetical protein